MIEDMKSSGVFFFQAEDGIRDPLVTGVQTCALPIFRAGASSGSTARSTCRGTRSTSRVGPRSEERRVGKECRSRWSPDHLKKKNLPHPPLAVSRVHLGHATSWTRLLLT